MKTKITLLVIVLFAFVLRVWGLSQMPPSLNWDEVSHGYNAYSILKTGSDEWGRLFPIFNFRAYGDYPLPLNIYLTIPSIAVFGLDAFSIRLPHVLLGTAVVLIAYLLTKSLTKKENAALLSALLVAIQPWHLFTSRFVSQSNLSVFFFSLGVLLLIKSFERQKLLVFAIISLGLSLFSYHTTRIIVPLFSIGLIFIFREELIHFIKSRKLLNPQVLIITMFAVLFVVGITNSESRARSKYVFLIDAGAINLIETYRNNSSLPDPLKLIVFNKPTYFAKEFTINYLQYFTPRYLFFEGGTHYQFSVPDYGLLYPSSLIFFYLGIFITIRKSLIGVKKFQIIFLWLALSVIPAAITREDYAVLRSSTMLPLPAVLVSIGASFLYEKYVMKHKHIVLSLTILYLISLMLYFGSYYNSYFNSYKVNYSWSWQYGNKELTDYLRNYYDDYAKIIITKKYGEPHEFILFNWPWDPAKYQADESKIRYFQSDWYWVDKFDKFYFVNDWEVVGTVDEPRSPNKFVLESRVEDVDCAQINCLLVTSPGNAPDGWNKVETINLLDGKPVYEIYEN